MSAMFTMSDVEDIKKEIIRLKRERNAVLLVHNYQRPEIQDVADFLGDSFGLAVQASETDADYIVFCGVDFMAESAKVLNPDRTVLHPVPGAKCPMAAMVDTEDLKQLKKKHPDAAVVSYVNTTAETKTLSDYCCTSSNAVKVVRSVPQEKVIFVPDSNLGLFVQRSVKEKEFIFWPGYCHVHRGITLEGLKEIRAKHPKAEILVHPECSPDVIDFADWTLSTEGMYNHVRNSPSNEFIIGTEKGMAYRLKKDNPGKTFYALENALCPNMKKITIHKVLDSLKNLGPVVELSEDVMQKARIPLERMVKIGRGD